MSLVVLGLESSCDETAAAVVSSDGTILSDVVHSQTEIHVPYGGVVPEIAARDHARLMPSVVQEALLRAGKTLAEVDGIASTSRPGLMGALLVGLMTAKGLAMGANKPWVGVDHLVGHLLAVFLRRDGEPAEVPEYPFVALLASGGHTAIYRVDGPHISEMRELGATRDDAAGEAFDKVAKLLGLGYPGGARIDALAAAGEAARCPAKLPILTPTRAAREAGNFEMSFSGIKSAVARFVEIEGPLSDEARDDLCALFQERVVSSLVARTVAAAAREKVSGIVLGGGVSANRGLRNEMRRQAEKKGLRVWVPPLASCTDNAAMIAYAGALLLRDGRRDAMSLGPATTTSLLTVTRKGGGKRPIDRVARPSPDKPSAV